MVASPFLPAPGWHRTGDGAQLLPDGRFELRGRLDRIVKIEERRISLDELEQRLGELAEVAAARVLPLPSGRQGLGAVVVPSQAGWQRLRADGKDALRTALLERAPAASRERRPAAALALRPSPARERPGQDQHGRARRPVRRAAGRGPAAPARLQRECAG